MADIDGKEGWAEQGLQFLKGASLLSQTNWILGGPEFRNRNGDVTNLMDTQQYGCTSAAPPRPMGSVRRKARPRLRPAPPPPMGWVAPRWACGAVGLWVKIIDIPVVLQGKKQNQGSSAVKARQRSRGDPTHWGGAADVRRGELEFTAAVWTQPIGGGG